MIETTLGTLPVLQSQLLGQQTGLQHFFTLRTDGDDAVRTEGDPCACAPAQSYNKYNLCDYTGDAPQHVAACRRAAAEALGVTTDRLWFPRQVHGTEVLLVDATTPAGAEADAVVTQTERLCIGVSTADCVPVLLYDPVRRAVAAIHAGWRGTVAHIVGHTIAQMEALLGTQASDLYAALGPSISPEAFEVGEEVTARFVEAGRADAVVRPAVGKGAPAAAEPARPHVDLWMANVMDLLECGVGLDHIDCTPVCSFSNPEKLFSARRIGIHSGRTASCIMLTR